MQPPVNKHDCLECDLRPTLPRMAGARARGRGVLPNRARTKKTSLVSLVCALPGSTPKPCKEKQAIGGRYG
eukprot:6045961-Lingulodinium_polyedra.AAC.1